MIEIREKSRCSGCHACTSICPKHCISMVCDEEGFWYPQVDSVTCINCGMCEKVCPILNPITIEKTEAEIDAYAAYSKQEEIRLNSSSGGMFTEIATYVIRKGGVVFGASFDENFDVVHTYTETEEELEHFRGSKYVQSKIGETYRQAQQFLKEGRLVLFTGTPCQIGGLFAFLKKPYENLITQDIICHGVPSPMVWKKYVQFREAEAASQTRRTFFRHKKYGWKTYSVLFEYSNNTEYVQVLGKDLYMRAFLADLCLRPSCYQCSFKSKVRASDFTIADFWGIQNVMPEMDDDKGTSLVFVNSEKGREIFEQLKKQIVCKKTDLDTAIQYNPSMIKSVAMPPKRDHFMRAIKTQDFSCTVQKYCKKSFIRRVLRKLRRWLRWVKK